MTDISAAREWGAAFVRDRTSHSSRSGDAACTPERYAAFGRGETPTLHLEDVSAIPFVSVIPGVERYQHRARVRADTGDVFAAVTPISEGYEPYCREVLGLGAPGTVVAEPTSEPTAVAKACASGTAWKKLLQWAGAGPVAIHPYMAIEDVWELAGRMRAERIDAFVVGPTTEALWVANDKATLDEVVRELVGDDLVVRTAISRDPATIAENLRNLADHSEKVGLKRTRCASAMGNAVFRSEDVRSLPPDGVLGLVEEFLEATQWAGEEEVLAVQWVETHISPSTQMWIPPVGVGDPLLEGIYEQLLLGDEKVFLGSRPARLGEAVHRRLGEASRIVAAAFQGMGYVGRCSFDFIVAGDPNGDFDVHFTECNGRWGGTSTPMFLVDRLGLRDENGRRPYHAQDFVHESLVGMSFHELLRLVGDDLYDPRSNQGRFVLYNVGPLERDGKFDVISLGRTPEEAAEGIAEVLPRKLGVDRC